MTQLISCSWLTGQLFKKSPFLWFFPTFQKKQAPDLFALILQPDTVTLMALHHPGLVHTLKTWHGTENGMTRGIVIYNMTLLVQQIRVFIQELAYTYTRPLVLVIDGPDIQEILLYHQELDKNVKLDHSVLLLPNNQWYQATVYPWLLLQYQVLARLLPYAIYPMITLTLAYSYRYTPTAPSLWHREYSTIKLLRDACFTSLLPDCSTGIYYWGTHS